MTEKIQTIPQIGKTPPQKFYLKTNFSNSSVQHPKMTTSIPNIIVSSFQTSQNSMDEQFTIKNQSTNNNKIVSKNKNFQRIYNEKKEKLDKNIRSNTSQKSVLREIFGEKEEISNNLRFLIFVLNISKNFRTSTKDKFRDISYLEKNPPNVKKDESLLIDNENLVFINKVNKITISEKT